MLLLNVSVMIVGRACACMKSSDLTFSFLTIAFRASKICTYHRDGGALAVISFGYIVLLQCMKVFWCGIVARDGQELPF